MEKSPDFYEQCVAGIKHMMIACGMDAPEDGEMDSQDFMGQECKAIVKVGTYEGKERSEVADLLPAD